MAHDQELKSRAEDLFVAEGLTLEDVARETGVPDSTVKRWSTDSNWVRLREEYLTRKRALKEKLDALRVNWMEKAMKSEDPQVLFAVFKLEEIEEKRRKKDLTQQVDVDRPRLFLEDLEFVAETLKEIDPEGLKVLSRSFEEITRRWKAAHEKAA